MKYKSKILLKFSVKISEPRQGSKEVIKVKGNNLTTLPDVWLLKNKDSHARRD